MQKSKIEIFGCHFAPSVLDSCSKEYLINTEKAIAKHMAIHFKLQKGYNKMIAGCHDADKRLELR